MTFCPIFPPTDISNMKPYKYWSIRVTDRKHKNSNRLLSQKKLTKGIFQIFDAGHLDLNIRVTYKFVTKKK